VTMHGTRMGLTVTAASTVGVAGIVFGGMALFVVFGAAFVALRRHDRMFPKGWDRTGWEPNSSKGWFATKVTWLSGGRGGL
jgi:hypothetical protein